MVKITVRYEDGLTNDIIIDDVMSVSNIINGILIIFFLSILYTF